MRPCEKACRRNNVDSAIAIKEIKRYVGDNAGAPVSELFKGMDPMKDPTKGRVAVVGAGPARSELRLPFIDDGLSGGDF